MNPFSSPEISSIMNIPGNDKCIDCGSPNPKWVSINNSVFLCGTCARNHNTFGETISKLKSLEVDTFSPEEIKLMQIGGNTRFNSLMEQYAITFESSTNRDFKYHIKIAEYHRQLLKCEIDKESHPQEYQDMLLKKPLPQEGLKLLDYVQAEPASSGSELKNDVYSIFSKVGAGIAAVGGMIKEKAHQMGIDTKIKEVSDTISGKMSQIEINPTIKSAGAKTVEVAKKTGEFIIDGTKKVYNSEVVQSLAKKAEEQYVQIKHKANEYLAQKNEQNQHPSGEPQQNQSNTENGVNSEQTPNINQI